jgi:hypothetical protein
MPRTTTYVTPRTIRSLSRLVGVIGLIAVIAGPVYAVNGATQAGAAVEVPVQLTRPQDADPARIPLQVADLPDGARVTALNHGDEVELSAWSSTVAEQLLSRGDAVVLGLAIGLGAWLLRPLLAAVALGQPFGGGNARRLAGLAVVVVAAGEIGPLLPQVGAIAVLDRLDLTGPDSPFVVQLRFSLGLALLVGALLLVLAEAFRQGERLSADVEGLV